MQTIAYPLKIEFNDHIMIRLELLGIFFIVIFGTFLHYTYSVSGNLWWVGIFSAMNESVWEHLKLAFWPSLTWSIYLNSLPRSMIHNFWIGRALALILAPILITAGYYLYTDALGHHALIYDLILFVAAIAISQFLALIIYRLKEMNAKFSQFAVSIVILEAILFTIFSFEHPDLPIFTDPSMGFSSWLWTNDSLS